MLSRPSLLCGRAMHMMTMSAHMRCSIVTLSASSTCCLPARRVMLSATPGTAVGVLRRFMNTTTIVDIKKLLDAKDPAGAWAMLQSQAQTSPATLSPGSFIRLVDACDGSDTHSKLLPDIARLAHTHRIMLDVPAYKTVLAALDDTHTDVAKAALEDMDAFGLSPSQEIFEMLIDSLTRGDERELAIQVLQKMRRKGFMPSPDVYDSLFQMVGGQLSRSKSGTVRVKPVITESHLSAAGEDTPPPVSQEMLNYLLQAAEEDVQKLFDEVRQPATIMLDDADGSVVALDVASLLADGDGDAIQGIEFDEDDDDDDDDDGQGDGNYPSRFK